ncbi:hypothetical protein HaLaN_29460 [Haematococcus lacustris]|uniref:Uncharacterized protein n=1 Tax=Haematococcus lacustris TaxID=44745 RepID=A0A6A0AD24_HAELA|nr:hypothetical protein HaLaN_29460 [Haematococcus lacustris]
MRGMRASGRNTNVQGDAHNAANGRLALHCVEQLAVQSLLACARTGGASTAFSSAQRPRHGVTQGLSCLLTLRPDSLHRGWSRHLRAEQLAPPHAASTTAAPPTQTTPLAPSTPSPELQAHALDALNQWLAARGEPTASTASSCATLVGGCGAGWVRWQWWLMGCLCHTCHHSQDLCTTAWAGTMTAALPAAPWWWQVGCRAASLPHTACALSSAAAVATAGLSGHSQGSSSRDIAPGAWAAGAEGQALPDRPAARACLAQGHPALPGLKDPGGGCGAAACAAA